AHCTGVDGILDELFDDRCRPLHDLAGRDLVDEIGGEKLDAGHRWIIGWPRSAGVSPAAAGRPRPAVEVTVWAGTLLHTRRRAASPPRARRPHSSHLEHDLPECFPRFEDAMSFGDFGEGEDAVDHWMQTALLDELHDLVQLGQAAHRGA